MDSVWFVFKLDPLHQRILFPSQNSGKNLEVSQRHEGSNQPAG
jgi:hypothetical protein